MPIKLLHHKSYHVYNSANIERVRRDEEEARAKEEQEDAQLRELDRQQRIEILRRRQMPEQAAAVQEDDAEDDVDKMIEKAVKQARTGKRTRQDEFEAAKARIAESQNSDYKVFDENRNVNFFEEQEKAPQSKPAKLINMRLDKPADELRPWYTTLDMRTTKDRERPEWRQEKRKEQLEKQKNTEDPLTSINMFLEQQKRVDRRRKEEARQRQAHVQRGTEAYYIGPGSQSSRERHSGRRQEPARSHSGSGRDEPAHSRHSGSGRDEPDSHSHDSSRSRSESRPERHEHRHRHHRHRHDQSRASRPVHGTHSRRE